MVPFPVPKADHRRDTKMIFWSTVQERVHAYGQRLNSCTAFATLVYATIAVVAALSLMLYVTGGRVAYTMDSLTYRDAALNFLAGHPMQATNVSAELPERVPSLQWPPAYPALWALMAFVSGADIDAIPAALNLVLLAITSLSLFWIGLQVSGRPGIAAIAPIANAFFPANMAVFGHAWSETLFIPLLLLAYAAFWEYRRSPERLFWLAIAAICIGAANWVRYAGVVFLPLLALMIVMASRATLSKRILHAGATTLLSMLLVAPLWFHNWQLTGNISGSLRGGPARHSRLLDDAGAMWDLFVQPLFSFSMVLMANLAIPLLALMAFVLVRSLRRHSYKLVQLPETWLPLICMAAYLVFLLYARTIQQTIDMDLRMLAIATPFLFLATVPAINASLTGPRLDAAIVLVAVLFFMVVHSGFSEGQRIHNNYAAANAPGWRATFGLGYRDLSSTSPKSRALKASIGPLAPSTLLLTDYRALYIRYLTGAQAYAIPTVDDSCAPWLGSHDDGLFLIGQQESRVWAAHCLNWNPRWRILTPTGPAAPSFSA